MLGGGLGLEMWKNRDSLPLRICRACPLLLESGSLGNGAADCPSVSPFLPLQAGGRRVLGGLGLGSRILGGPRGLGPGGRGLLGLVPVSAGFLELVPPRHLSFQVLQVLLAEEEDRGEGGGQSEPRPPITSLALLKLKPGQNQTPRLVWCETGEKQVRASLPSAEQEGPKC